MAQVTAAVTSAAMGAAKVSSGRSNDSSNVSSKGSSSSSSSTGRGTGRSDGSSNCSSNGSSNSSSGSGSDTVSSNSSRKQSARYRDGRHRQAGPLLGNQPHDEAARNMKNMKHKSRGFHPKNIHTKGGKQKHPLDSPHQNLSHRRAPTLRSRERSPSCRRR